MLSFPSWDTLASSARTAMGICMIGFWLSAIGHRSTADQRTVYSAALARRPSPGSPRLAPLSQVWERVGISATTVIPSAARDLQVLWVPAQLQIPRCALDDTRGRISVRWNRDRY